MDIDALDSRLDGVKYYDTLIRTNYGVSITTDIYNQCIKDTFWPWRSDEYIIKYCCRSYAEKMKISVADFVLIDGWVINIPMSAAVAALGGAENPVSLAASAVSVVEETAGVISELERDEVTIYRLYERGSLDIVWKGHVKNYGKTDDELNALLERKGIRSPKDEAGMKARRNQYKYGGPGHPMPGGFDV